MKSFTYNVAAMALVSALLVGVPVWGQQPISLECVLAGHGRDATCRVSTPGLLGYVQIRAALAPFFIEQEMKLVPLCPAPPSSPAGGKEYRGQPFATCAEFGRASGQKGC